MGTFLMSREVGARMAARGSGAIVNITSLNAVQTSPDAGAYPATKAAIAKLTEQFALALGPRGVRVNAVGPGFIDAGMSTPIYRDPGVRKLRSAAVPAGRIGTGADVAAAVVLPGVRRGRLYPRPASSGRRRRILQPEASVAPQGAEGSGKIAACAH